jgi:hypothetical protein
MQQSGVQTLLMGGQACVIYGGAEFSRDTDLALLSDSDNLGRFEAALIKNLSVMRLQGTGSHYLRTAQKTGD